MTTFPSPCFKRNSEISDAGDDSAHAGPPKLRGRERAMAARDRLDHDVLGSFNSRMAPAKAGRAAENIAYGYDDFKKTLDQWINSAGHRKNLLLPKASRVGVASAKSATSLRTYWAMVIAGDYEKPRPAADRKVAAKSERKTPRPSCRLTVLGICF